MLFPTRTAPDMHTLANILAAWLLLNALIGVLLWRPKP